MWWVELWEGKDQPQQLGKKWGEMSTNVGFMLIMTEPINETSKIVTHDSGFYVSKIII